jgi:uncharacterized membrane protein
LNRDRCFDFENIFAAKIGEKKLAILYQMLLFMLTEKIAIAFVSGKRFRLKLARIAENSAHNIDP